MRVSLAGMAALAVAMGLGRFAFTPLLPMMQRDAGLSLTDGGWLASANYLGYLVGAVSTVWVKATPTTMVRLGLLLTAALTVGMGATHGLPFWLPLRGLGGVASAWVLVYAAAWALPLLARWNQSERSGLMFSGVGAGIAATGLLCLSLAEHGCSSQTVWHALGGLALALSLFVWVVVGRDATPSTTTQSGNTGIVWTRETQTLVICYGVFGFGYIIPATFLPVIARQALHDAPIIGFFWPVFGLAAFLSTFLASSLSDRRDERGILAASFALQALGVAAVVLSPAPVGVALCALLVGGTFMVITMQGLREARRLAGPEASRLMGTMTAAFAIGQIIGPLYAAVWLKLSGSFTASLLTASVLMALGALALFPSGIDRQVGRVNSRHI